MVRITSGSAILTYVAPVVAVLSGLLLGVIGERLLLPRLAGWLRRRGGSQEALISILRGNVFLWFLALGIYLAILFLPLAPRFLTVIGRVLFTVVALSVTLVVARLAEGSVRRYGGAGRGLPAISLFSSLTRLVVFLIGVLVILQAFGVAITPILTALGVGGLAVALALQDTLANLFAGLHILAAHQVRVGDYIKLDSGEEGYVTDISWRNTTIRERPDNLIIVPNARLAAATVTNFERPNREVLVPVEVGVSYDSDLESVERVTLDVARNVMGASPAGVAGFEPFLRFKTLSDYSIEFVISLRAREFADRERLKHEFIKRLVERYRQEDIEIPFPVQVEVVKMAAGGDGRKPGT